MALSRFLLCAFAAFSLAGPVAFSAEVKVQWLFNFDAAAAGEPLTQYEPQPSAGEVAPQGPITAVHAGGTPPTIRRDDSGGYLELDGTHPEGGAGLRFNHPVDGEASRIFEALVRPAAGAAGGYDWAALISSNDASLKGGNFELRLTKTGQPMIAARNDQNFYQQVGAPVAVTASPDRSLHIAGVYDINDHALYLYLDGELVDALPGFTASACPCEPQRTIGISNSSFGSSFTGLIDAVAESTYTGQFTPADFVLIDAEGPAPSLPAEADRQVELVLPPDVRDLPKAPGTRHVVYHPPDDQAMTYHHGAIVLPFKGRLVVAWQATLRDEHTPPYVGLVSVSDDLTLANWSEPLEIGAPGNDAYLEYIGRRYNHPEGKSYLVNVAPRQMHATEDRLYLWCLAWTSEVGPEYGQASKDWASRIFWTEDGDNWHEIPPEELDTLENEKGLGSLRSAGSNHQFTRLRDGRLMAYNLTDTGLWCPTTEDPTGLTGWGGGRIDSSDCADVGEPGGWQDRDGVLHGTARWGQRIWHSYSTDGGQTWTKLTQQMKFPDCPGNKDFGMLPNGDVFYVGNPVPGSRMELVLGLSHDGWTFDRNYLVRWEPHEQKWPARYKGDAGYQYPDAAEHDGKLYVAYSVARDFIEVTAIDLDSLPDSPANE